MNLNNTLYQAVLLSEKHDYKALEILHDSWTKHAEQTNQYADKALAVFIGAAQALGTGDKACLVNEKVSSYFNDIVNFGIHREKSILFSDENRYHTSTLGLVYGALRNSNLFMKNERAGQLIREIRAFVFENLISGGVLMSDDAKKDIRFDTLLACVPFGLFEPEDLVLVEAVKALTKKAFYDETSDDEKMLLAWYYVEQGSYGKVRDLLTKTNAPTPLKAIVEKKLKDLGQLDEMFILHNPEGNGNRYEPQSCERHPYQPFSGDTVTIDAVAVPLSLEQPVHLKVGSKIVEGKLLEDRWQFVFKPETDQVDYELYFAKKKEIKTKTYRFHVGKRMMFNTISGLEKKEMSLRFYGKAGVAGTVDTMVELRAEGDQLYWSCGPFADDAAQSAIVPEKSGKLILGAFEVHYENNPFSFAVLLGEQPVLQTVPGGAIELGLVLDKVVEISASLKLQNEKLYGFGERYNRLNQRGEHIDQFVYNQYKDQGVRTYMPMPLFYTTSGYGMHMVTESYSWFDIEKTKQGVLTLGVESESMTCQIATGRMLDQVQKINRKNGPAKRMPLWALGPWMSSNNWDSDREVRKQVELTKQYGIPSTVLVIEAWSDESTFYIFNDAVYEEKVDGSAHGYDEFDFPKWGRWPDPKNLVEYLHENNLKCILWQIPIIKQITSLNHLQKSYDEKHFTENDFCVRTADGQPYRMPEGWFKDSLLMDFSSEAGKKWWFEKRQYLIDDLKVDGFKTDGGEFVFGRHLAFSDGRSGLQMRNAYPNDYIEAYYNLAQENDGITFSRAGYTGAQKFPAHWAGDERSTFDAFKRSILAGLSSGLSGIVFWGWDLGGFSGEIPTAELFIRSAQMATFCPIMQYHAESKAEFNQDRTPWNIAERTGDSRALSVYRYFANLRMSLLPYIEKEAEDAVTCHEPLMRPLVLDYEEDEAVHEIWDTYSFGKDLIVAPVIEEGATSREVYLPQGKWWHMFDQTWIAGGQTRKIEAPLETIPVFVRENRVIPMNLSASGLLGDTMSSNTDTYGNLSFIIVGNEPDQYRFKTSSNDVISMTFDCDLTKKSMHVNIEGQTQDISLLFSNEIDQLVVNGKKQQLQTRQFASKDIQYAIVQVSDL